jgi:phosphoglycerate kinase
VFVMDAFATAHRSEASTVGVAKYAKIAAAGPLLIEELEALAKVISAPKRPLVAIVGGAKISSKLLVLKSLLDKVDTLILGGGIANTFCKAKGLSIGKSLVEENLVEPAKELLSYAKEKGVDIILPSDAIVATEISEEAKTRTVILSSDHTDNKYIHQIHNQANDIQAHEMILDVGEKSLTQYQQVIEKAGTILWNGPIGVFEFEAFSLGTKILSKMIAKSKAFSVAGGGETLAAIDKFGVEKEISYISTGGGAFLEYIEGKKLPAVAILEERSI